MRIWTSTRTSTTTFDPQTGETTALVDPQSGQPVVLVQATRNDGRVFMQSGSTAEEARSKLAGYLDASCACTLPPLPCPVHPA